MTCCTSHPHFVHHKIQSLPRVDHTLHTTATEPRPLYVQTSNCHVCRFHTVCTRILPSELPTLSQPYRHRREWVLCNMFRSEGGMLMTGYPQSLIPKCPAGVMIVRYRKRWQHWRFRLCWYVRSIPSAGSWRDPLRPESSVQNLPSRIIRTV